MSKSKARFLAELLSSDGKVIKTKSQASTIIVSDLPTIPNSKLANSSVTIAGEGLSLGASLTLDTGDVTEHTAYKYYTDTRARASISATGSLSYDKNTGVMSFTMPAQNTSNITEGSNLYYTDTRARAAISATGSLSYNSTTGVMSFTMPAQNTSNITEGSNLYYTNARADARIVNAGSANWNTAYGWGNHASAGYSTTDTTYSVQDGELSQNNFTNADHSKLDGIAASANNYSHPSNHAISVITGLQTALDGKVDDSQVLTNVPSGAVFTDTNTTYSVGDGGLSQNNFTNADHTKLNAIEASADVTDSTNVVAALTAGTNITISAGGTIASTDTNTTYSVGDGGLSQNNFTNADHSKLDGIATGATNTAAPHYTSAIAVGDGGLTTNNFTTTLKNKLDGIAASANNYVLPSGYATESYVGTQISNLVDSSPAALNTLNELAAAIGDDASFSTTVTNNIATKLPLAGGALTGAVTTNSTFDGRNVSVDGTKLDTIATSANNYVLPFTNNSGNWNTAYGWGNHASGGYAPASHNHSGVYLPIAGKAADSNLLDGIDSTGFVRQLGDSSTGPNYLDPSSRRVNPNASNPTNVHYAVSTFGNFGNVSGQLATHYVSGAAYTRGYNSAWSAWRTQWDSLNDGAGSGLDADLLDGQQGSYYATASGLTTATATANAALPKAGGTITGNLNVNGTTTLGNGNADQTHINDTLYLGATDSGDSHFYFGENSSNWYGDHWYWDSGYEVERNSRYAGTDTLIEKHDTRYTHKVQTNRAYERLAHSTGYQIGSYNSVGDNSYKTNPIYVIGDSYRPSDTSVSNMYGTGYSNVNLWGNSGGKPAGWGHYVVEGGTYVHITSNGGTWSLNEFNRNGNKVWDAGNDGGGSGLDADLLDGQQGSYYLPTTGKAADSNLLDGIDSTYFNRGVSSHGVFPGSSGHNLNDVFTGNGARAGFIDAWSGTNFPPGTSHIQGIQTRHNTGSHYGWQLFGQYNQLGKLYHRQVSNGTFGAWSQLWNNNNDGSGSGLDADTVRGSVPSFTDTNTNFPQTGQTWTLASGYSVAQGDWGLRNTTPSGWIQFGPANTGHAHIYTNLSNFYFNVNTMYQNGNLIWAANNDGAGSGLDADLLDGVQGSGYARLGGTDHLRSIPNRWFATADADNNIDYYQHNYAKAHLGNTYKYTTSRPAITTDSNYWVGTMGWGTITFADLFKYGSGDIDTWTNPSDQPSGTSHWVGSQHLHYHNGSVGYGTQRITGAGNPSLTFIRGTWGGAFTSWYKDWNAANDGAGSGLVADYATKVTFNTQGNSNTTLKLLLGDTSNSTIAAGTVYKDNELSYNTSSNTLNTGSINFSNWNYQAHLNSSGSSGPSTHYYVTQHSNGSNAYQSGWNGTVASQGASNLRTLGVSSTGELSNDIVEQTFTMTRAQFNAMSVGQNYPAFTFSNSRGSNPGRAAIVFEVILCMRYTSYSSAALSSTSGKIMRLTSHNYTQNKIIAEFRADSVSNMTQSSFNNSLCSFLYQDRESRLYHCENDINFVKFTSATLGSHVTSLTVKVRYKMYDGASF